MIDQPSPEIPGDEVARALRQVDPAAALVLMTGWRLSADDARLPLFDFRLTKPLRELNELQDVVDRAILLCQRRRERAT